MAQGRGKDRVFIRTAKRNTQYLIGLLGDRPIASYSSSDAATFRDWLISRDISYKTVKRVFSSIRAIVNLAIAEEGLDCSNAFAKTYFPEDEKAQSCQPISIDDIRKVQSLCSDIDDDMRWLIALISDTVMRLGEAAGLHMDDIKLDEPIQCIDHKPYPWRSLKTKGSQRRIPLVGSALWVCERLREVNGSNSIAFPRYCGETSCNANSDSHGLNKWLHQYVPDNCVIHSFRHSLHDRLRAVECPADIVDTSVIGRLVVWGMDMEMVIHWKS